VRRRVISLLSVAVGALMAGSLCAPVTGAETLRVPDKGPYTAGLYTNGTTTASILPEDAVGSAYVPHSNVLVLPTGQWRYLPPGVTEPVTVPAGDPGALKQIRETKRWLRSGTVPGESDDQRAAAERALLSMRALLQANGAAAAGWHGAWKYSWPRDTTFNAVAFARTGHPEEALRILRYNAATQRPDGTWEARTTLDGAGPPDDRKWQLDANGWVPWAVWQWYQAAPEHSRADGLHELYPTIRKAADYAANSLDAEGLPPAAPDYWEIDTTTANIGTAAPLLSGLNASASLARRLGNDEDADRWAAASSKLSAAIAKHFAPLGYQRTVDGLHGRDSAAAFMAPPFNEPPPDLDVALDDTFQALRRGNGGLVPGDDPGHDWGENTWTPSTSFFALAWSGMDQDGKASGVLDWVLAARNSLGELPEKVAPDGTGTSMVPLGWTDSIVLMALSQLDQGPMPVPPRA